MFGIGILVALGRRLAAAALADTGILPAAFYRHLALAALEEEDFPQALKWLPYAQDPVLTQLLVLRLRLLGKEHEEQRRGVQALLDQNLPENLRERGLALLDQENKAAKLLKIYERQALKILGETGESASQQASAAAEIDPQPEDPGKPP